MNQNNKKQIIVLGVLGAVFVAFLGRAFLGGGGAPIAPPPNVAAPGAPADGTTVALQQTDIDLDALLEEIEVVTFNYPAVKIDRDPMFPLPYGSGITAPDEGESEIIRRTPGTVPSRVIAIIWDERDPVAVVRNDVEGDAQDHVIYVGFKYPNGVVVSAILPDRVIFKMGDSEVPVFLKDKRSSLP